MKIWKLDAVGEKYDYLIPANGYDIEEIYTYDGRSHKDEWNGRKVILDVVRKKLILEISRNALEFQCLAKTQLKSSMI